MSRTAMILAAGRGERMRPLTDQTPKPLLQVANKPLIVYALEKLAASGYTNIVINHAWLGAQIESTLGDGSGFGVNIHYSPEGDIGLETGGGIHHALPLLGHEPFIIVNSDVWSDVDFSLLHLADGDLAQLVMVPNPPHHAQGDFALVNGKIAMQGSQTYTYSGIAMLDPRLFAGCKPGTFKLRPVLEKAMKQHQVSGTLHQGYWMDIGTPERLQQLNQMLNHSTTA